MLGVGQLLSYVGWRSGAVVAGGSVVLGLAAIAASHVRPTVAQSSVQADVGAASVQFASDNGTTIVLDDDDWMASVRRKFDRRRRNQNRNVYVSKAPEPRVV